MDQGKALRHEVRRGRRLAFCRTRISGKTASGRKRPGLRRSNAPPVRRFGCAEFPLFPHSSHAPPPPRRGRGSAAKALRRRGKMRAAASCSPRPEMPRNVAPDASGNSKANRNFPAECPCRVLLALCPPTASTFPSPRTAETSAAQVPRFSALCRSQARSRLNSPTFAPVRRSAPPSPRQRHPATTRISAPLSPSPGPQRRRTRRSAPPPRSSGL